MQSASNMEYAASCNPPRRAKRTVAIAPLAPALDEASDIDSPYEGDADDAIVGRTSAAPSKRGRKPASGASRAAKTAQRKLNHSIIEKARRTKINDALATLRRLVPDDYGVASSKASKQQQESPDSDADDDVEDEEYGVGNGKSKSKAKSRATGKKEAKEKEFKLEILVRTVSYMQDLLERVKTLETAAANLPTIASPARKRKRNPDDDGGGDIDILKLDKSPLTSFEQLPSISSWLHNIDPTLLPAPSSSQLPSPPSSATFHPIMSTLIPPVLTLDQDIQMSVAGGSSPNRTTHSPEDESAASLLLQIRASPAIRPSGSNTNSKLYNQPMSYGEIGGRARSPIEDRRAELRAETPSSWLGISMLASSAGRCSKSGKLEMV